MQIHVVVVLNEREEILVSPSISFQSLLRPSLCHFFPVTSHSLQHLSGYDLFSRYGQSAIAVIHFPICDFDIPSEQEGMMGVLHSMKRFLERGLNVLVHCHAGKWRRKGGK
jgi:hypothetical protein